MERRTRKHVKGYGFLSFVRNLANKYGRQLLDTATKAGLDALKTASKKVIQKAAEATGLIGAGGGWSKNEQGRGAVHSKAILVRQKRLNRTSNLKMAVCKVASRGCTQKRWRIPVNYLSFCKTVNSCNLKSIPSQLFFNEFDERSLEHSWQLQN